MSGCDKDDYSRRPHGHQKRRNSHRSHGITSEFKFNKVVLRGSTCSCLGRRQSPGRGWQRSPATSQVPGSPRGGVVLRLGARGSCQLVRASSEIGSTRCIKTGQVEGLRAKKKPQADCCPSSAGGERKGTSTSLGLGGKSRSQTQAER